VDLVPSKTCNLNCVFCQLGPTGRTTMERAEYAPVDQVVAEVRQRLAHGPRPDYVTLGGSGEPTLHSSFGEVATRIRRFTDVPVALMTNGTLFHLPEVRQACGSVDLVLPTLDAGDEETFRRIHRPHPSLTLEKVVSGLAELRREFAGQIWLEVFIVEGVNSSDEQVGRIRAQIERVEPDRIQINVAVRPPAERDVKVPPPERLERIRELLGRKAEVIVPHASVPQTPGASAQKEEVLAVLRRRPCTLADIAAGLGIPREDAARCVEALVDEGTIQVRQRLYETYYEATAAAAD
jgi:wyosine [tRNA(Phe)-imidazoG37] synthetase (radical SAM superfamily)